MKRVRCVLPLGCDGNVYFYTRPAALLKRLLVRLRTYYALKMNKVLRYSVAYRQARSMGVLCVIESVSDAKIIGELAVLLRKSGKTVTMLALIGDAKKKKEFAAVLSSGFFTAKDFSNWGHIAQPHVKQFVNTPFDYLYCVDNTSNVLIYCLLAQSKALCRVGAHKAMNNIFFEMMIDAPSTLSLVQAMYAYTQKIR